MKDRFHAISLVSVVLAWLSSIASASVEQSLSQLPRELGHLSAPTLAFSESNPSSPVIYIIQDAHGNEIAQRNVAAILDILASQHGLRLILVEGGEGDAS